MFHLESAVMLCWRRCQCWHAVVQGCMFHLESAVMLCCRRWQCWHAVEQGRMFHLESAVMLCCRRWQCWHAVEQGRMFHLESTVMLCCRRWQCWHAVEQGRMFHLESAVMLCCRRWQCWHAVEQGRMFHLESTVMLCCRRYQCWHAVEQGHMFHLESTVMLCCRRCQCWHAVEQGHVPPGVNSNVVLQALSVDTEDDIYLLAGYFVNHSLLQKQPTHQPASVQEVTAVSVYSMTTTLTGMVMTYTGFMSVQLIIICWSQSNFIDTNGWRYSYLASYCKWTLLGHYFNIWWCELGQCGENEIAQIPKWQ